MATVTLSKVCKSFGKQPVVRDFDLEIADGEFLVLLGPSGCGKSTTLRMIAGLEDVSSGEIAVADQVVNDIDPKDRNIAMVFQNYALYPHMTVHKNLAFGLRMQRLDKSEIAERVSYAADILQLTELLDRLPAELSGGQRQRVAMGRAIVRTPVVFLFDEPLSNLDAVLRTEMRAEIKKLHRRLQTTSIYVTHDQVEAMTLADRIVVMRDGVVEQIGPPKEIFNNPANLFVARFIGNPQMNLHQTTVEHRDGRLSLVAGEFELKLDNPRWESLKHRQTVTFGIRPNDIHIVPDTQSPASFAAVMDLTELLGAESLIEFSVDGVQFAAIVADDYSLQPGDHFSVQFNLDKMHIFE